MEERLLSRGTLVGGGEFQASRVVISKELKAESFKETFELRLVEWDE